MSDAAHYYYCYEAHEAQYVKQIRAVYVGWDTGE
jgi:hypothetical protein